LRGLAAARAMGEGVPLPRNVPIHEMR
jgi:hypothetical protein